MKMRTSRGSAWFWLLGDRSTGRERQWQVEATWLQQPRFELRGRLVPSSGGQHDQQTGSRGECRSGNHLSTDSCPEKREAAVASSSRSRATAKWTRWKGGEKFSTCPQPTAHNRVTLALAGASPPSSPRASSSSMLPSSGFSRCTYRTRGRPPAARNVDLPACGCIAFCWHLGLGAIHFWPFSGQSSLSAQQAESPPPQQRRVRVYTGAAPAAPPRHLAQPWSKGTWRIGIGDQPSRDKERSKHTLFRTLSRL